MSYAIPCFRHRLPVSPLYWRPEGKTFRRCPRLLYCPGTANDPHILREIGWNEAEDYHELDKSRT